MRRLLNPLFFAARQRLAFRRAGYAERPGSGPALDRAQRVRLAGPRAAELAARYGLEALRPRLADATWLVVLSFADLLDRVVAFEPALADLPEPAAVLDVGAKNFEAAPALLHVLARAGRGDGSAPRLVRLTGSSSMRIASTGRCTAGPTRRRTTSACCRRRRARRTRSSPATCATTRRATTS